MANEEHLAILKQGVGAWNQWREENPNIRPDLIGTDLMRADLHGANLHEGELRNSNFSGANLSQADLSRADLTKADFSGADLNQVDLRQAILSRANLNGTNLYAANLRVADLVGADLHRAKLMWADLRRAKLSLADLSVAHLLEAKLSWADLHEADLRATNLRGADLLGANLNEANLAYAEVNSTRFDDVDLSMVKGLETVKHFGPSTIGIDTIYKSKGNIPNVFLRGCGVPDTMIAYVGSLVGKTIEYYSCFISYSSKNQDFAERLHVDLQGKGVRCWFAPKDLKLGAKIQVGVDESIRKHDKLLLVLSQEAIAGDWVEQEVETALARERDENRLILFPIRLDSMVMDTHTGWLAHIKNTRNIGDFSRWKDHDAYHKAFDRLLRDLKMESAKASE